MGWSESDKKIGPQVYVWECQTQIDTQSSTQGSPHLFIIFRDCNFLCANSGAKTRCVPWNIELHELYLGDLLWLCVYPGKWTWMSCKEISFGIWTLKGIHWAGKMASHFVLFVSSWIETNKSPVTKKTQCGLAGMPHRSLCQDFAKPRNWNIFSQGPEIHKEVIFTQCWWHQGEKPNKAPKWKGLLNQAGQNWEKAWHPKYTAREWGFLSQKFYHCTTLWSLLSFRWVLAPQEFLEMFQTSLSTIENLCQSPGQPIFECSKTSHATHALQLWILHENYFNFCQTK